MTSQVVDDNSLGRLETANEKPMSEFHEEKQQDALPAPRQDAFGDEEFAEVKYRVLKWWFADIPTLFGFILLTRVNWVYRQGGFLMVAETISLGILSLPAAVAGLGLAPGLIILVGMGIIASYNGYVYGQIKWRFPHVSSMADAGEILLGSFGREFLGAAQLLVLVFIMASHVLTFAVALNTLTNHGTCSIVFGIVSMVVSIFCALPRTLVKMSWPSLVCEF